MSPPQDASRSSGPRPPVDVITVPDFTGPALPRFELRTLLFLGSWLRHRGASRTWPLHLACIGEPPASVRHLAALAGASVTVHAPMPEPYPATGNKLRGLEITPRSERFLLLDTDVLVLTDLDPLAGHVGDGIGAGPARFNLLSEATWRRIFDGVGVAYPTGGGVPPYFNSGVLMAPWALGLGPLWREHTRRVLEHFEGDPVTAHPKWSRHAEQHALATAVAALRLQGVRVVELPLPYQARPYLLTSGALRWRDVALFHYVKVFAPEQESVGDLSRLLYGRRLAGPRRWLAGRLGLRAVRSPLFRLVAPDRLRAYPAFYQHVHQIFRDYIAPTTAALVRGAWHNSANS
ncbi:MAG: hypothetical protein QN187_07625 [Armatimonadota bacterium]|nr:hypothetical protein [Armatimonadota bacterium]